MLLTLASLEACPECGHTGECTTLRGKYIRLFPPHLTILPTIPPLPPPHRNTIKALNWYAKVRVKLDDPAYADWFIKFDGFSNNPYPGGEGLSVNGTFHVPVCDWFNNGTRPRCSGFYHDQVR